MNPPDQPLSGLTKSNQDKCFVKVVLKGQAKEDSDVDLLVDFGQPVSLFKFAEMENYLSDLLHTKVDLVMKDALKPHIGARILNEVQYL
jgi:predicted nucleotidyltransferase